MELVFESPVWSGFLMPKSFNHNRNRSAFFLEVKKPRSAVFLRSLDRFSVYIGFNRFMTGLSTNILKL